MIPLSTYQEQLLAMAFEIIRLWWWEPSFEDLKRAARIRLKNISQGMQNDVPNVRPYAINHVFRKRTKICRLFTFLTSQTLLWAQFLFV